MQGNCYQFFFYCIQNLIRCDHFDADFETGQKTPAKNHRLETFPLVWSDAF